MSSRPAGFGVPQRGPLIEVVTAPGCPACQHSRDLVAQVRTLRPDANINLTDEPSGGEPIIATPTYLVNGRTVSLGNPELAEILEWIDGTPQ